MSASWPIGGADVGMAMPPDLIGRLVRKPLVASNISPAETFRVIKAYCPTAPSWLEPFDRTKFDRAKFDLTKFDRAKFDGTGVLSFGVKRQPV